MIIIMNCIFLKVIAKKKKTCQNSILNFPEFFRIFNGAWGDVGINSDKLEKQQGVGWMLVSYPRSLIRVLSIEKGTRFKFCAVCAGRSDANMCGTGPSKTRAKVHRRNGEEKGSSTNHGYLLVLPFPSAKFPFTSLGGRTSSYQLFPETTKTFGNLWCWRLEGCCGAVVGLLLGLLEPSTKTYLRHALKSLPLSLSLSTRRSNYPIRLTVTRF